MEGHLKFISPKGVELADETPSKMAAVNYADYPLVILSRDGKNEIARVTGDENGNCRVALPPGDYVLDVQDRRRRHIRATPQPFTVVSNQTHCEIRANEFHRRSVATLHAAEVPFIIGGAYMVEVCGGVRRCVA